MKTHPMMPIPPDPVAATVLGLTAIAVLALVLPFSSKRVEENLEPFFLVLGAAAVTVSRLWSSSLIVEALKAPIMIGALPVGIFQVVLVVGLLIHYFNRPFCKAILSLVRTLGPRLFVFALVAVFGLLSSVMSVIVVACFAAALGACLTPLGEPLSTILVAKLAGAPYHAGFFFPFRQFSLYLIPGVFAFALAAAIKLGPKISMKHEEHVVEYPESLPAVVLRAAKVFAFIAGLVLLGEGFRPLVVWYFTRISPPALYWLNMVSAVLDNATLTAIEVGPAMTLPQITGIVMGLSIAGGMLIPGNIPNIVAAGRMKIGMKAWARVGVPVGLAVLAVYFIAIYVL
jgi:predicted cation transporter